MPTIRAAREFAYGGDLKQPNDTFEASDTDADYYIRFGFATWPDGSNVLTGDQTAEKGNKKKAAAPAADAAPAAAAKPAAADPVMTTKDSAAVAPAGAYDNRAMSAKK